MPLNISIKVVHDDEENQKGPIIIEALITGGACRHEVAVWLVVKKALDQFNGKSVAEISPELMAEAMTAMSIRAAETGQTMKRRI